MAQVRASPTMIWGWFDLEEMKAWHLIFPLTLESRRLGYLPLSDPAWLEWENPWWIFPSDRLSVTEAKVFNWRALSPLLLAQRLSELGLEENGVGRRIWIPRTMAVRCWGNEVSKALVLIDPSMSRFSLMLCSRERNLGILEHVATFAKGVDWPWKLLREVGWCLLSTAKAQTQLDVSNLYPIISPMKIILWNCRGALNLRFHTVLTELINAHSPSIVIVTETRVGGERAKEITSRLPFDEALHADTVGYSGGIWVLWNSDEVEVTQLAKTE